VFSFNKKHNFFFGKMPNLSDNYLTQVGHLTPVYPRQLNRVMENGKVESGKWKVENGKWKMQNGKLQNFK
jgi:hypothetical protein